MKGARHSRFTLAQPPRPVDPRVGRSPGRRRGSVLFVVLIIITLAALATTSVLYRADAQRGAAGVVLDETRLRALAWSGVQGAMAELASRRDSLLDGGAPEPTNSWDLFRDGGMVGRIRLAFVGVERRVTVGEGGKLDLNSATAEMLAKLPGMDSDLAAKVLAARGSGFGSVEELAAVEGLTEDVLYGAAVERRNEGEEERTAGLLDHVTTFSFDPDVQAGLGAGGEAARGEARVNLRAGWSDESKEIVSDRLGAEWAERADSLLRGKKFARDSELVAALRSGSVSPKEWPVWLDVFTTGEDEYRLGRVDLSSASEAVLRCVPGIDEQAAARIVAARDSMDSAAGRSAAWVVAEGVLSEESFQTAVDYLTTRSLQWRVRVVASIEAAGDGTGVEDGASKTPARSLVWEAVIDVSSEHPRVAYLRDVTHLDLALLITREERLRRAEAGGEVAVDSKAPAALEPAKTEAAGREADEGDDRPRDGEMGDELELGDGLELNTDLAFDGNPTPEGEEPVTAPAVDDQEAGVVTMKDRRIGRWRGKAGGRN